MCCLCGLRLFGLEDNNGCRLLITKLLVSSFLPQQQSQRMPRACCELLISDSPCRVGWWYPYYDILQSKSAFSAPLVVLRPGQHVWQQVSWQAVSVVRLLEYARMTLCACSYLVCTCTHFVQPVHACWQYWCVRYTVNLLQRHSCEQCAALLTSHAAVWLHCML